MGDRKFTVDIPPDTTSAVPKIIQNRLAFLVGINSYVDNSFSNLKFCVNDVKALENTLSSLQYTTVCLNDELKSDDPRFPSRDNIEAELTRLCKSVGEDDLLWVHFACHGTRLNEQPVLIAQNTREATLSSTSLSLVKVEELMRQSKAKRKILTLDACQTGVEMGRDFNAPDFIKNTNELAEGYAFLSASTAKQAAQEWKDGKHGVFTYYLLTGLKGNAKDNNGFITVNNLQKHVVNALRSWSVKQGGQPQEPTYRAEGIGDIILADLKNVKPDVPLQRMQISFSKIEMVDRRFMGKQVEVNTSQESIEFFEEKLDNTDLTLKMAKIPRGKFLMGSSENEDERLPTESPQHEVTLESFFIGMTLVTQCQWRAVAALPKVEIKLEPEPSHFSGADNHPVEKVSWFEAVEFCDRLSRKTGRQYRLPSEAEWEYACRANTKSPFHYGRTISTGTANYRGTNYKEKSVEYKGFYGEGGQGKYREKTTDVMQFNPNAFGLYDMHGNVYEWCADCWHDDYQGAPADGRIWTGSGFSTHRVLRGGSWANNPGSCRSASRLGYYPEPRIAIIGFRVMCDLLREGFN